MTQLVAGGSTALTAVAPVTAELQLVARQPEEMQRAQLQLVAWFDQKIAACRNEAADANDNLAIAQRSGWKLASFRRQSQLAGRRVAFYEKCKAAVEAGYALVPNFPVDVFAVRTTKVKPKGEEKTWNPGFSQKGEGAPLGAGEYVSDLPFVEHRIDQVDDGKGGLRKVDRYWPSEFDVEIEYPLSIAHPAVMSATAEALARKIFDEVGSLPERRRKGDPIVVGRICGSLGGAERKVISFLIAWYVDTREL